MRALSFSLLRFYSVFRRNPAALFRNPGPNLALCRRLLRHIVMEAEVLLFLLGTERILGIAVLDFLPVGVSAVS